MAVAPNMTFNAQANAYASTLLAASGTVTIAIAAQTVFEVQVQCKAAFGTVAATSGLQVQVFRRFGAGPTDDTIPVLQFTIPSTTSTTKYQSFALPTGKYDIVFTNLDATNAITTVECTTSTVDSIG